MELQMLLVVPFEGKASSLRIVVLADRTEGARPLPLLRNMPFVASSHAVN